MTDTKDVILAIVAVVGLGLLIYAGKELANWFGQAAKGWANWWSGVEKGVSNWAAGVSKSISNWETNVSKSVANWETNVEQSGGLIPWSAESGAEATANAISAMNKALWNIPPTESQFDWARQKYAELGSDIEKAIGNWWSGVENRFEKSLTTW